ncbi:NECA3 protein, partial [Trogon melanurus]|nr:NECA3 protein [Trogon melanurus]
DDGKLSFEEFKNYFADGILSSEELWELFSGIDRRHSERAELVLLCSGDTSFLVGLWQILFQQLLILSPSPLFFETSSKMEQFLTRFLLREFFFQLQSLQASLECAVDTVEEQAGRERKDVKKSETSVGLRSGRRCGRRGQIFFCLSPTDPYSGMLTTGTCSLTVPRVGVSAPLEPGMAALAPQTRACPSALSSAHPSHSFSGVCDPQSHPCSPPGTQRNVLGAVAVCHTELRVTALVTPVCPRSVSACKLTDEACFILYEFWQDVTSWRSHLQSSCSKTFQRAIISLLESPELLTTMLFPGEGGAMGLD